MAILGLLLVLAVAGVAVGAVSQNTLLISVDAMEETFMITPGWLFVAGLASGAIGALGLSLVVAGLTRTRRRRAALAESRNGVDDLQAERDRLAAELERERERASTSTGTRADHGRADGDRAAVIDLDEEQRRSVPSPGREPASDGPQRVEPGRHRLFARRH